MESCWGEDNMKIYTVNMKKAVAKCNQVDAPELDLPPYRAVDRFVNVMLSFAREMESNQFDQLYKMMGVIHENQYRPSYNKYRRPHYDQKMDRFQMMMKFKEMMDDMQYDDSFMNQDMMPYSMMKSKYNNKYGMDNKMKHQSYKMDEMRDSSPIAAFRSAMNFDNNNHKSMDFNKMANFFKNFRSKRAADTDA